jgi:hypothetical protein
VFSPTYPQQLAKKREVKAKQTILNSIEDHLIPHISKKKMVKEIFNALVSLYQSGNINKKMMLLNKLKSIVMIISNSVTSYLMKVTQVCDQLATIGEKVTNANLVNMALNVFPTSREPFVKVICAKENLPNFERVWDDYIQEETQVESKAHKKGGKRT